MQLSTSSPRSPVRKFEAVDEELAEKAKNFLAAFGFNVHRAGKAVLVGDIDLDKLAKLTRKDIEELRGSGLTLSANMSIDELLNTVSSFANEVSNSPRSTSRETQVLSFTTSVIAFTCSHWDGLKLVGYGAYSGNGNTLEVIGMTSWDLGVLGFKP